MKLDRTMFKRLVGLYIVAGVSSTVAILPQLTSGRWYDFEQSFDLLVLERFGPRSLSSGADVVLGVAIIAVAVWVIASSIGLLFFRRWARFGLWASMAAFFVLYALMYGFRPVVTSPWDQAFGVVDSGLFGAILLMAYGGGLGTEWFAKSAEAKE